MKYLISMLALMSMLMLGCSASPTDATDAELRTTVQFGLLSVVGDDKVQAQNILDAVHEAQRNLRYIDDPVPLDEAKETLKAHINWSDMNPHQQILANDMIELAMIYIEDDAGGGVLNEEQEIRADKILGWIESTMLIILDSE